MPQKKVAIVYYDREMGKGNSCGGSSTGMHLNAPRKRDSGLLNKMKDHGYRVDPLPQREEELIDWMIARGRLVGVWAPGELDQMVRTGSPVLIPAAQYEPMAASTSARNATQAARRALGPCAGAIHGLGAQGREIPGRSAH